MELRHPDERDEEPGGARSRHGQALGHRGIRRHEESQHGTGTFIYDIFCIPVYIFLLFAESRLDRNGIIVPNLVSDPAFSRQRKLFVLFRNLLVFIIRKYCRYVLNGKEGDWKEKLLLGIRIRPNPILTLYRNNLHLYKFCKFSCKLGQLRKKALLPQH